MRSATATANAALILGTAFASLLPSGALSSASSAEWEIDAALAGDPRTGRLLEELEEARRVGAGRLRARFGLGDGSLPVSWRLLDAASIDEPAEDVGEFIAGRTLIRQDRIEVLIPARRYLARPRKARTVVVHESSHALLASSLGRDRYLKLPGWFREGFALLAAGEGEARLRARIAVTVLGGKTPRSFLRELAPCAGQPPPTGAQGYLATRLLIERLEDDGYRELVRKLRAGRPFGETIEEMTRLRPAELHTGLLRASEGVVSDLAPPGEIVAFRGALERLRRGGARKAARTFSELSQGSGGLARSAGYFRARALLLDGDCERARPLLESLLEGDLEGIWEAETLNSLAECALSAGQPARARRLAEECLERFPDDGAAARGARKLLSRLGKRATRPPGASRALGTSTAARSNGR